MIRLYRIFQNPFLDPEISVNELGAGATDTQQRLIANNPGAAFNTLITGLTVALATVATCTTDDIVKLGLRKAAKQAKDTFREVLPKHLGKVHAKVAAHYGVDAPELNQAFPNGREIFHTCPDDQVSANLQAVINGITPLASAMGALGAAALGDASGLLSTWTALYAASESTTGAKTNTESEKRDAKNLLAAQMHLTLLTLALHFVAEAKAAGRSITDEEALEKAALYFRQDLFEDPSSPEEPENPPVP